MSLLKQSEEQAGSDKADSGNEFLVSDLQAALPEITDEDRQFLHYNPNTSDLVEWVQAYATKARDIGADYVLDLLVAAGQIPREKAFQARDIARDVWQLPEPIRPDTEAVPTDKPNPGAQE